MAVDFKWTLHEEGVVSDRPTAGTDGRLYYATDEEILYYDDGDSWTELLRGASHFPLKTLFDANTILKADVDDTPEALTIAAQRLVGRITGGEITALTGAQVMALLSGQAGATFDLNAQDLSNIGHIGMGHAAQTSVGLYYEETLDVGVLERTGFLSYLMPYKTSAPYVQRLMGVHSEINLVSANTQDWTNAVGLRAYQATIGLVTGTVATSTITGAACFYGEAWFGEAADDMVLLNYYGLYLKALSLVGNSKLTNCYGIKVEDQEGGATLNYAIYTNAGLVRFGDTTDLCAGKAVFYSWGAVFADSYYLFMRSDYSAYVASITAGELDLSGNTGINMRVSDVGMIFSITADLMSVYPQASFPQGVTLGTTGRLQLGRMDIQSADEADLWYDASEDNVKVCTGGANIDTLATVANIATHTVAHPNPLQHGYQLVGTDLYVDDTAIGFRWVWIPSGYHIELEDTTGKTFYVAS